jgi:hypothetical protein
VFAFTRSPAGWSQDGAKLIGDCVSACSGPSGTGELNLTGSEGEFGASVALSADGRKALIGAPFDSNCGCDAGAVAGSAWLFGRSATGWSQLTGKLTTNCRTASCGGPNGTGELNQNGGQLGASVALSGDGRTALIGAPNDNCATRCDGSLGNPGEGAAWIFSVTLPRASADGSDGEGSRALSPFQPRSPKPRAAST